MLSFLKRNKQPQPYAVIVCGAGVAACTAVLFTAQKNLRTLWLTECKQLPTATNNSAKPQPTPFDSLSPEGVSYLRGILQPQQIVELTLGTFKGVTRNGNYTQFDSILGEGIHLNSQALKTLLIKNIQLHNCITIVNEQATAYATSDTFVEVTTNANNRYKSHWLINGQGEHSTLSQQSSKNLTEDIWVERYIKQTNLQATNTAEFNQTATGWQWQAVDAQHNTCVTKWNAILEKKTDEKKTDTHTSTNNSGNSKHRYNAKWYKRPNCVETTIQHPPRNLLIGTTYYRLDPSAGLGLTTQLKSALLAIRCIHQALRTPHNSAAFIKQFEYQMETSFKEIAYPLAEIYNGYSVVTKLP